MAKLKIALKLMDKIQIDEAKVRMYAQIQENISNLGENSTDDDIERFLKTIPPNLFNQKDELMMICEIFALYGRLHSLSIKKNVFKLFEKIMKPIKTHLQDESHFFWKLFGGHLSFKLWFYEEGLINIEDVIMAAQNDKYGTITEIFLPEILKNNREIFEKELKFHYKYPYDDSYVEKFIEKRSLHINWLKNSCDYNDQIYSQIETDKLRLSIKRDDADSFQKIISESNLSLNSSVFELSLENEYISPTEMPLLDYSIRCNSINVFKFLIMNDAELSTFTVYHSIESANYEIIHIIESKTIEDFAKKAILASTGLWNREIDEYIINNFDEYAFLQVDDDKEIDFLNKEQYEDAIEVVSKCLSSSNFILFESTILPFLKKNPSFVNSEIHSILFGTFGQMSCFFTFEFMMHPNIDFNYHEEKENNNYTLLSKAVDNENSKAIKFILSMPGQDINSAAYSYYPVLFFACKKNIGIDLIDLICKYPGFNINTKDKRHGVNAFDLCMSFGNFYITEYILKNFPNLRVDSYTTLFFYALQMNHLYTLKIALKYILMRNKKLSGNKFISDIKSSFGKNPSFSDEMIDVFRSIVIELGYPCPEMKEEEEEEDEDDIDFKEILQLLRNRIQDHDE